MNWKGDIEPANIDQVRMGSKAGMVTITDDVGDIARRLKEIDKRFALRWSEAGEYFVVYCREPDTDTEYLVGTYRELDGRVVEDIQRVVWENRNPGYDFGSEIDKAHDLADAARDYEFSQKIGESAEQLAFAIRKDLGMTHRIVVPESVN